MKDGEAHRGRQLPAAPRARRSERDRARFFNRLLEPAAHRPTTLPPFILVWIFKFVAAAGNVVMLRRLLAEA